MSNIISFGDRMKMYESTETQRQFLPGNPVYARIDGRGFSRFTKGLRKPYDDRMMRCMIETTKYLVDKTNASIGYTQSDEISLCWYTNSFDNQIWFNGRVFKMTSNLASLATLKFYQMILQEIPDYAQRDPTFDTRVFQLPSKVECANAFLWREQDATKNAVSCAAQSMFSHKELQNLNGKQMQEKMWQERGVNFNDYPAFFKRGVFVRKIVTERFLTENELQRIPEQHRPTGPVLRNDIVELDMPKFSSVKNRVEVIFDKSDPVMVE